MFTSQGNNKNNTLVKNEVIFNNLLTISEKMSQWKLSPTTVICVNLYGHYGTYLGNFRLKCTVSMATQKPTFKQFPKSIFQADRCRTSSMGTCGPTMLCPWEGPVLGFMFCFHHFEILDSFELVLLTEAPWGGGVCPGQRRYTCLHCLLTFRSAPGHSILVEL